jgi:hypothetical protein
VAPLVSIIDTLPSVLVALVRTEAVGSGRVACGEAVELVDGRVAVGLVVDDGDPMPCSREDERCGEAGGTATDDQHVAGHIA